MKRGKLFIKVLSKPTNYMKRGKDLSFLGILILLVLTLVMQFVFAAEISDESSTTLQITGLIRCDKSDQYYGLRWIDGTGDPVQYWPTTGLDGNCLPPGPETIDASCCPRDRNICSRTGELTSEGKEKGICDYSIANSCIDLKTESQCNTFSPSLAEYFYNKIKFNDGGEHCYTRSDLWWEESLNKNCWNETTCRCMWNGSSCIGALNYTKNCGELVPTAVYGVCENPIISIIDECETTGYITYTIGADWKPLSGNPDVPPDCVDDTQTRVPCGTVAKLGFFSIFNFISVMISLIMIYYFYGIKKR